MSEQPNPEVPSPVPAVAASVPPSARRSVQVPVWLLVVLAVGVVAVGAFFVGRETAPASESGAQTLAQAVELTASGEMDLGDFELAALLDAIGRNRDFDLGDLGDLILGGGRN